MANSFVFEQVANFFILQGTCTWLNATNNDQANIFKHWKLLLLKLMSVWPQCHIKFRKQNKTNLLLHLLYLLSIKSARDAYNRFYTKGSL